MWRVPHDRHVVECEGVIQSRRFMRDDIYSEYLDTFYEMVTTIAVLSNEWKELQHSKKPEAL